MCIRDSGRAAAEELVEMLDLDEAAVFGRVEIDAATPHGDDVEHLAHALIAIRVELPQSFAARDVLLDETICKDNSTTGRFAT